MTTLHCPECKQDFNTDQPEGRCPHCDLKFETMEVNGNMRLCWEGRQMMASITEMANELYPENPEGLLDLWNGETTDLYGDLYEMEKHSPATEENQQKHTAISTKLEKIFDDAKIPMDHFIEIYHAVFGC